MGASDGWQDFARNGAMTWEFRRADDGNVAMIGELPAGDGVLALGFAVSPEGAATLAGSALAEGFAPVRERFLAGWEAWRDGLSLPRGRAELRNEALLSAAVLKVHEDRTFPGATVASLSVPWGFAHHGYHLVWARDAVETGLALLAIGDREGARRMLSYLAATQEAEGCWSQNFYPDGRPYWTGIQLDEVGFPIVLAAKLRELGATESSSIAPMVRAVRARSRSRSRWPPSWRPPPGSREPIATTRSRSPTAGTSASRSGRMRRRPSSPAATAFAATTSASARVSARAAFAAASRCGTAAARRCRRLRSSDSTFSTSSGSGCATPKTIGSPRHSRSLTASCARSCRPAPPTTATSRTVTAHADGSPFDGTGIGRPWPLLAGERGHGALLRGEDPVPYLESMARMTSPGGLIPEQVWDAEPLPERNLFPGKPSGSAMPLVWAHGEYLRLYAARASKQPVELLATVEERYRGAVPAAADWFWREQAPVARLPAGRALVIEAPAPFALPAGFDGWQATSDRDSAPLGFGMHGVRLEADESRRARERRVHPPVRRGLGGSGLAGRARLTRVCVTLIVNPCAHRVTEERLRAVERELRRSVQLTTVLTERRGHATELAHRAEGDAIVAYGGDGLSNEVLNGATGSIPLGFLPGGHTNVLPRALGLPRDPGAAAALIVRGRTRRISLGRVNGRRFAFSAGIAVGAEAVRRVDALGRTPEGRRASDLTVARIVAARLLHGYEPALEIAGFGRAAMAFVSNDAIFSCAGPLPVRLSPKARFELGLDLSAPVRVDLAALVRLVPRLAIGSGLTGTRRVLAGHDLDRIEVHCDEPRPLQADGEDLGDVEHAVFEAERSAVSVLVP